MSETELREALRAARAVARHPIGTLMGNSAGEREIVRDVEILRAVLASIPAEPEQADEGLDVERLARALVANDLGGGYLPTNSDHKRAQDIARTYARLAARDGGEE